MRQGADIKAVDKVCGAHRHLALLVYKLVHGNA